MRGVARIWFDGGAVVLPAETPYEQEVLFEYLEHSAKRFGEIRLELDRQQWQINLRPGEASAWKNVGTRKGPHRKEIETGRIRSARPRL